MEELEADIAQVEAKLADPEPEPSAPAEPPSRGRDLPDHLPHHDLTLEPPGLETGAGVYPCCGGALHDAGETVARMIDYVPAQVQVLRIRRPKYACRGCGMLHQAPAPEKPIAKGMATPAMLAHVITSRYCDHLPFYRQAQILARNGLPVDRSVLTCEPPPNRDSSPKMRKVECADCPGCRNAVRTLTWLCVSIPICGDGNDWHMTQK